MRVVPTPLPGVILLEPERACDERGSFTRLSCVTTLAGHGTLRGLRFQAAPSEEIEIVHCIGGAIFDVALYVRR